MKAGKEMKVEFEERQMARDLEAAAEAGALVSKANAITQSDRRIARIRRQGALEKVSAAPRLWLSSGTSVADVLSKLFKKESLEKVAQLKERLEQTILKSKEKERNYPSGHCVGGFIVYIL